MARDTSKYNWPFSVARDTGKYNCPFSVARDTREYTGRLVWLGIPVSTTVRLV